MKNAGYFAIKFQNTVTVDCTVHHGRLVAEHAGIFQSSFPALQQNWRNFACLGSAVQFHDAVLQVLLGVKFWESRFLHQFVWQVVNRGNCKGDTGGQSRNWIYPGQLN